MKYTINRYKNVLRRTDGVLVEVFVHPETKGRWILSCAEPHRIAERVDEGIDTYITEDEIRQQFPLVPLD